LHEKKGDDGQSLALSMQATLAQKFGQRVKEKSSIAVAQLRREVAAAAPNPAVVQLSTLEALLAPWGFKLEESDRAKVLETYPTKAGTPLRCCKPSRK
jgi:hypothetical protein